ncbi:hypothetical protein GQX73_g4121 [Xylaria multiplex]|uniref:Cytochrome P450 n=1 Tax=Xylaria multiplex TaxID=323545 RepID=A0A7C8IQ39_9PEZI|nr:hypothetical protein GQX73_g4121 [Xylaria multiplex]
MDLSVIVQIVPTIAFFIASVLIYLTSQAIYRLHFSPLSSIPGPKLAALTYWYEFYYDGYQGGKYTFKIKEFHEKHGPIVRINPHHVHINDINFYDTIYAPGGAKHLRNKIRWLAIDLDAMFNTYDAALHRKRRAAVASPFSKQAIRALEPAIFEIINDSMGRLQKLANHVAPNLHAWGRMFPWVFKFIEKIPMSVLAVFDKRLLGADKFDKEIGAQIKEVLKTDEPHIGIKNVFHEMRDSKHLPTEDKCFSYYKSEAASFVAAGTETTASALTTLTYFVLANPDILHTLREELKTVMPINSTELPPTSTLENLPYLTGVIQEGIRLSFSVPGRLPRTAPDEELVYKGYRLPPGTVISQSSYLLHTDEKVFPEAFKFKPERWVNDTDFHIRRHFVAFSRGARGCIGINLAYAELYPAVAALFSRFELKLYKTSGRDVEFASDRFIGHKPEGSQGGYGHGADVLIDREHEAQSHEPLMRHTLAPELLALFKIVNNVLDLTPLPQLQIIHSRKY